MISNAEIRAEARQMLKGRWKDAVLMNLVPTLIGIAIFLIVAIPAFIFFREHWADIANSASDNYNTTVSARGNGGGSSSGGISGLITTFFTVGISYTFLDILRGEKERIEPFRDVFRAFHQPYLLATFLLYVLQTIFTILWTLLFIIPGIVKSFSYSQSYFIYYDTYRETGQTPRYLDTITASRQLMDGYKGQLFFLYLSFIGWAILCGFTLGIGLLWLNAYIDASKAAFYNHLPKE